MRRLVQAIPRISPLIGLLVLLLSSPQAGAAFKLTLHQDGFQDKIVIDGGAGDAAGSETGLIIFVGRFGSFELQATVGSSNSSEGVLPAVLRINSLSVNVIGSVPSAPLVLTLEDNGFSVPSQGFASMSSELSTTFAPQGTNVRFQSFLNSANGTSLSVNGVGGDSVTDGVFIGTTPYTLKNVTTITMTHMGAVQTNGLTMVALPAPAGLTLVLAGAPFAGLGFWIRRRKFGPASDV
jgi:hypothetical protein